MLITVRNTDLQSLMSAAISVSSGSDPVRLVAERLGETVDPESPETAVSAAVPGQLRVIAFSDTMVSELRCPAEIRRSGSIAILAEGLNLLVRASKGTDATFGIETLGDGPSRLLRLSTSRSAHDFAALSEAVFETVMPGQTHGERGDLSNLADAMSVARSACASRTEAAGARIALTGVHLRRRGGNIDVVGTDGVRLAITTLAAGAIDAIDLGAGAEAGITLPADSLSLLTSILQEGAARFEVQGSSLLAESREGILSVRLIDVDYPDYTRLISGETGDEIRLSKPDFEIALSRSSVAIARDKRAVAVKLTRGDDGIHLSAVAGGQSSSECLDRTPGNDLAIGFDAKYMLTALGAYAKGDVILSFQGAGQPIRVTSPNRPETQIYLMPCRIN